MNIVIDIIFVLVGFVLLIKGADYFVDGASALARKLRIPSLIVGLTIVALGTSLPELAVSVSASVGGQNSIAVSNVVGSNTFNLLVVLGVCALITPLAVTRDILRRDLPVSIFCAAVTLAMLLFIGGNGEITIYESILLLALLAGYITWTVISALKNRVSADDDDDEKPFVWWKCTLCLVLGAAAIAIGGDIVVDHASSLGIAIGMSESLVGLTICAVGTSLPELVTSIAASKKGENDMAIGNVVGSNILNILCILGVSSTISPITLSGVEFTYAVTDFAILILTSVIGFIFCTTGKRISRAEGGVFVALYISYMIYAIIRNGIGTDPIMAAILG